MQNESKQRGRKFKGFLSKVSKSTRTKSQTELDEKHHDPNNSNGPYMPRRNHPDFLPNPEITASPNDNYSHRKIWEGAYSNYLSGNSASPESMDKPRITSDKSSSFSVIPGTKRLVTNVPQHLPSRNNMPSLDSNTSDRMETSENSRKPFLRGMFNRATSEGSTATSRRSRNPSLGSDDLDSAMRNGMNKHSPEYSNIPRKQGSPQMPTTFHMPTTRTRAVSQEDIPSSLNALLAGSSHSPHFSVETGGVSRVHSYGVMQGTASENVEGLVGWYPQMLPKGDSTGSFNYGQTGLSLEEDSLNSSSISSEAYRTRATSMDQHIRDTLQKPLAGIGSLLEKHASLENETHSNGARSHQMQHRHISSHQSAMRRNGISIERLAPPRFEGGLHDALHGPDSSTVGSSPSGLFYDAATPPTVDLEQKRMFTAFHNQARFARDSTSAFLGSDGTPSPIRHDSYIAHPGILPPAGHSLPFQAASATDLRSMGAFASSIPPLETVDEHDFSISKNMRMLKVVTGTESWEKGRRYLIAPAALAASPLIVVNRLSGGLIQTATAACENTINYGFGIIDLGECLMTYTGSTHHLSLGQWSACHLVLRQNFLLEFDTASPITGVPRGYIHLQYASASAHSDFQNSFVLNFYASPCAKSDYRTLMIRTETREECGYWVDCLNRAASLKIEDLWDCSNIEFGRGRYATVFPARRKQERDNTQLLINDTSGKSDSEELKKTAYKKYDRALKVINKAEFWRRVVKGHERADTLVRETSVQGALTAKCSKVGTFLQLLGFFETSENIVIELELLEGTDLFHHISSKGQLSESEATIILRDMLTSLDAMNRVGLAHRDIKPANILMCNREERGVSVKIGDFGMSTFVAVDGMVRGRCGTPGYAAPEILNEDSRMGYSNAVDIFSAGVTLYVMLCGYEPFYGENEKALIESNRRGKIEFPADDWSHISSEACDLIRKMTEMDPRKRISAKDALKHPWVSRLDQECQSIEKRFLKESSLDISNLSEEGLCTVS